MMKTFCKRKTWMIVLITIGLFGVLQFNHLNLFSCLIGGKECFNNHNFLSITSNGNARITNITDIRVIDTGSQNTGKKDKKKYLRWVMLAGDSNWRAIFVQTIKTLKQSINQPGSQIVEVFKTGNGVEKDKRWVDIDAMVTFKNASKIRLSFRFIHGAVNEITRIDNNWSDIRHCMEDCPTKIKDEKQREIYCKDFSRDSICAKKTPSSQPEVFNSEGQIPDVFFYTHGLWGCFEKPIRPRDNQQCQDKLGFIASHLHKLSQKQNLEVVWFTNPTIYLHPVIKDEYLKWETNCQIKIAKEKDVQLFNLRDFINKDKKARARAGNYHISSWSENYFGNLVFSKFNIRLNLNHAHN